VDKLKADGYYIKEKEKTNKNVKKKKTIKTINLAMGLGFNLALPLVAGVFLGRYFDSKYEKDNIFTLIFIILGLLFSLYNIFKIYKEEV